MSAPSSLLIWSCDVVEPIILLTLVYFSDGPVPKHFIEPTNSMRVCETWKGEAIKLAIDNSRVDLVSADCLEH